jgi:hypothetical protein
MNLKYTVRVTIPAMLFFGIVEGLFILWHYNASDHEQKTIEFAAAIVAAGTAIYSLLLGVHANRVKAAGRFIERWNEPAFQASRHELTKVTARLRDNPDTPMKEEEWTVTEVCLNFFEDLSIAVLTQRADEETVRSFFRSVLRRAWEAAKDRINRGRTRLNQPTAFENLEKLYDRWRT